MSYLVLARKWRPQTFAEIIGQPHVSQTLQNAIESRRVAHAYLFTGARGVGKTSVARIFAKALNCEQGLSAHPCNVCSNCREITQGNAVDVLEIDGASNTGVDNIRELRETIRYRPAKSRYKIYIIDEVHMLSTAGFQCSAENPRRTTRTHRLYLCHHRTPQDPGDHLEPLPAVRFSSHRHRSDCGAPREYCPPRAAAATGNGSLRHCPRSRRQHAGRPESAGTGAGLQRRWSGGR